MSVGGSSDGSHDSGIQDSHGSNAESVDEVYGHRDSNCTGDEEGDVNEDDSRLAKDKEWLDHFI